MENQLTIISVSYTHLDVYKRQAVAFVSKCTIEIERPNKDNININEEVEDMVRMAEKKAKEVFNKEQE